MCKSEDAAAEEARHLQLVILQHVRRLVLNELYIIGGVQADPAILTTRAPSLFVFVLKLLKLITCIRKRISASRYTNR